MKLLPLILCIALAGCTIIPTQHGKAQFWGDYTNVQFDDGSVHFHADSMIHSTAVRAHWHGAVLLGSEAVTSAIPGVGIGAKIVAPAVPAIVSGLTAKPSTPPPAH